jgi:hypothetical protein
MRILPGLADENRIGLNIVLYTEGRLLITPDVLQRSKNYKEDGTSCCHKINKPTNSMPSP